jgi:hypothetical protein
MQRRLTKEQEKELRLPEIPGLYILEIDEEKANIKNSKGEVVKKIDRAA